MKKYGLVLIVCFLSLQLNAQKLSISGQITDTDGNSVIQADVILKTLNGEIETYTSTDTLGNFRLKMLAGKYRLEVHHLAYLSYVDTIQILNTSSELKIKLKPKQENLSEVIIKTKKPLLEKKLDRLVINVENHPVFFGSSGFEMLSRAPGIYRTGNEDLQMLGKSGLRILVNGRLQHLSGDELTLFLKNMSAEDIVKIELLTTPPSNYEAEGNAGYINIITKKLKEESWKVRSGFHYGQGKYARAKGNIGFQYQHNRMNADLTYHAGKINSFENIEQYNEFGESQAKQYYRSYNHEMRYTVYHSIRSQLDWELNKKSLLSFVSSAMLQKSNRPSRNHTFQFQENSEILQEINTSSLANLNYLNYSNDLYYEYKLDTLGKKVSFTTSLAGFGLQDHQMFRNRFQSASQLPFTENLQSNFNNQSTIKAAKLDLKLPYENSTWETGIKYASMKAINNFIFENFNEDKWELDPNLSNDFIYREQNTAAYISFQTKLSKKWQGKAGLRAEYTDTRGKSPTLNQVTTYNYLKLFPTLYLQYEINEDYQMDIAFARRINRPNYGSLNPFITYQSPLFSNQGNPLLRPEFTYSLEWNHILSDKYIITPFYNYTEAYYTEFPLRIENSNETRYTFGNLGTYQSTGIQVILPFNLTKKIAWQHSLIGLYQNYRLSYNDIRQEPKDFFWRYQASISINFSEAFKTEISGYYESSSSQAFYRSANNSDVSLGVTYTFLEQKARLTVNVTDLFYSNRAKANIEYPQQSLGFYRLNDTRRVQIGFTYEFGQQLKNRKTVISASEEEQSRG
ncbi:TonB-dependent receptor domain-containing protein [Mesonia maritima]|uniref:TonB-dependent receptor domain-containing protein n=1 Tax=Mesonia maritima TaxID=1793873 RepID=UPI00363BC870